MKKYDIYIVLGMLICVFCFLYNFSYGKTKMYSLCSQIEYDYYFLSSQYYTADLRFGLRESVYRHDLVVTQKIPYGVLTVKFFGDVPYAQNVVARLLIDDEEITCILEKNPFDSSFVCDLKKVYSQSEISLYVDNVDSGYTKLTCANLNFESNYDKALNFAFKQFKSFIDKTRQVECYLTIYSEDQSNYYWSFVIFTQSEIRFVIFDDNLNIMLMS